MNYISWLYFAQSQKEKQKELYFLYGLSLPTNRTENIEKIYDRKISGKNKLICATIITENTLNIKEKLDFSNLLSKFDKTNDLSNVSLIIYDNKTVQISKNINDKIPTSVLSIPLFMHSFYTNDFNRYYDDVILNNKNKEFLFKVIELLEEESKQPFTKGYTSRLGCYEIGEIKEWSEYTAAPCYLETKANKEARKRPYILKKEKDFYSEKFTLHLIIYNDKEEILYDGIKVIKENEKELIICEFDLNDDSSIEYWIFDKDHNLILRDKNFYIKQIGLSIGTVGDTYTLPANIFSKKSFLSKEDHILAIESYSNSTIEFRSEVKHNTDVLSSMIRKYYIKDRQEAGKFFTKKNENEFKEIIDFFNEITQHDNYKIAFIDPFISGSASLEYLMFFKNSQIDITLISCWDKNTSANGVEDSVLEDSINETCFALDSIQSYGVPLSRAKWFNLSSKKFHDRYIYLQNSKNQIEVYSISNSLNNILSNYENILILPLLDSVKQDAINYIESLIQQCNRTTQIYPRA